MANVFLSSGSVSNVTDGSTHILGASIGSIDLSPGLPVKVNSQKRLFPTLLAITDTTGLQTALDSKIGSPLTGGLELVEEITPGPAAGGTIKLYANVADGAIHSIDSASNDIALGPIAELTDLSTGVLTGGTLSVINATDYQILAGTGQVITGAETGSPTKFNVSWNTQTNTLSTIGGGIFSAIGFTSAGALIEQNVEFTNYEKRNNIVLGVVGHGDSATIDSTLNTVQRSYQPLNALADLQGVLGTMNAGGNIFSKGTGLLQISRTSGTIYSPGSNAGNMGSAPGQNTGEDIAALAAEADITFLQLDKTGAFVRQSDQIDPDQFQLPLTSIQNNFFTIQRIYIAGGGQTILTIPEFEYKDIEAAELSAQSEAVTIPAGFDFLLLRGYLVVQKGETDLTNSIFLSASFIPGGVATGGVAAGAGDIMGPATSTVNNMALWNNTTGSLQKDSVVTVSTVGLVSGAVMDDGDFCIAATADNTKLVDFDCSSISTSTTHVVTFANASMIMPVTSNTSTLLGDAIYSGFAGSRCVGMGQLALDNNSTGNDNTGIGYNALGTVTSSSGNVAVGSGALALLTGSGDGHTALGCDALANAGSSSFSCTAVGRDACNAVTTADDCIGIGRDALLVCTEGDDNVGVGRRALGGVITSGRNCAFGHDCLAVTTSGFLAGFGYFALTLNSTGTQNSAFGYRTLASNTTGSDNSAFGYNVLDDLETGSGNTGLGSSVLGNATGSSNTCAGASSGSSITTGAANTCYGRLSGGVTLTTGSGNVLLGHGVDASAAVSDGIAIGRDISITSSGEIRIGDASNLSCFIAGIHGVTISSSSTALINANGELGTVVSSRRFKHTITDMEGAEELYKLRPRNFYYTIDRDPDQTHEFGLIAEETDEVIPNIVVKDDDGNCQTVQYFLLIPRMLDLLIKQKKQIDELSAKHDDLVDAHNELSEAFDDYKESISLRMETLESLVSGFAISIDSLSSSNSRDAAESTDRQRRIAARKYKKISRSKRS